MMRPSRLRSLLGALVYPGVIGLAVWAALKGFGAGVEAGLVVLFVNIGSALLILSLERALPYRTQWNRSVGDVRTDILHTVVSGAAGEVARGVATAGLTVLSIRLSAAIGAKLWPADWPLAAQLALAFPIAELGVYWLHRLEHSGGLLWRLHAVHHSAPRLYFLNSARNHPLDSAISLALLVAPLVLLGVPERTLSVAIVIWAAHALLQHSNIDVRLGPLNWLLSMAEVHRWHHSRRIEEANANYGQTLLLWDIVFGTRRVPKDREPPVDVGLTDLPSFPAGWLGQIASPFRSALWRPSAGRDLPESAQSAPFAHSELPPKREPTNPDS